MRIAFLSHEYPPDTGFGGIGTYTWTQARALAAMGHEVEVLAGAAARGERRVETLDGVLVRRRGDRARRSPLGALLGTLGWWWSLNRLENGVRMRRLLGEAEAERRFDLIEFPDCGAEARDLGSEGASRRIVRFHSPAELIMPLYDTGRGDRRLCAALERRSIARAGRATSCSAYLAREAARIGLARAPTVIPNGIDVPPGASRGRVWRDRLGLGTDRPMLLFAGRLEPRKGIRLLAELVPALLESRDVSVVIAGDDLFQHAARELEPRLAGRKLAGRLRRLGRQPLDKVRELQLEADVIWIPSLWESCPYSVLEAMVAGFCGAAIVASEVGGIPELVRHGEEALLAAPHDLAAHRAAIEALLDAPERRHGLAAAARRRVERELAAPAIARRSLELYEAVAAGTAA